MPKLISVEGDGHCCHRPSSNWETNQQYFDFYTLHFRSLHAHHILLENMLEEMHVCKRLHLYCLLCNWLFSNSFQRSCSSFILQSTSTE